MIEYLLIFFVCLTPLLGKNLDYLESVFFYGPPLFIFLLIFIQKKRLHPLPSTLIKIEILLFSLYIISVIFSKNIGFSYYQFFQFFNSLFIINLLLSIKPKPGNFQKILLLLSISFCIVFLLNYFHLVNLPTKLLGDNFIKQVWGHSYLSELLVISIPLSLSLYIKSPTKTIFLVIFFLISLVLTQSRIAITISILFLISFAIFIKTTLPKKYLVIPIFIGIIGILYLIFSSGNSTNTKSLLSTRFEYWQQATKYFLQSPIIGNGPGTFDVANNKLKLAPLTTTSLAHNSALSHLSENGLVFTCILIFWLYSLLIKVYKKHQLTFFAIVVSIFSSLLDTSWNTIGIFIITIFLLLSCQPNATKTTNHSRYIPIQFIILLIFFISKTTSDILFLSKKYDLSIDIDPFNPNPRYSLMLTNTNILKSTIFLYANDQHTYQLMANKYSYPQNIIYLEKLTELNPKDNYKLFENLINYYQSLPKYRQILNNIVKNFPYSRQETYHSLQIAKNLYHQALIDWPTNPAQSLKYLHTAINFAREYPLFHYEYATALWQNHQSTQAIKHLSVTCLETNSAGQHCLNYMNSTPFSDNITFGSFEHDIMAL